MPAYLTPIATSGPVSSKCVPSPEGPRHCLNHYLVVPIRYEPHSFSRSIAKLYNSVPVAIVYQYIWFCSVKLNGGGWTYLTVDKIAEQYSYMGRRQVWLALQKLIRPSTKKPALVEKDLREDEGTCRYKVLNREAEIDLISFDIHVATQCEMIAAAIIHQNIAYWVRHNWRIKANDLYEYIDRQKFGLDDVNHLREEEHRLMYFAYEHTRNSAAHYATPKTWHRLHPYFSIRTIKRALAKLKHEGLVVKLPTGKRNALWTVSNRLLAVFERQPLSPYLRPARKMPKGDDTTESVAPSGAPDEMFEYTYLDDDEDERNRVVKKINRSDRYAQMLRATDILDQVRRLNRASLPAVTEKIREGKRKYIRVDPENILEALEDLTPEERTRYLENAKKRRQRPE